MSNGVKTSCPVCASPYIDIAYWEPQLLIGEVVLRQYCQACPAMWEARYVLHGIRNLAALGQCGWSDVAAPKAGPHAPQKVRIVG